MEFSRQEYWSGLLCPPPGDLPNSGIKPASLTSPALSGRFFITSSIWEALSSWAGRPNLLNHTTNSYLDSSQSLSKFHAVYLKLLLFICNSSFRYTAWSFKIFIDYTPFKVIKFVYIPCAVKYVLVAHYFKTNSLYSLILTPICPSLFPSLPLITTNLFSVSVSLCLLCCSHLFCF